MAEIRCPMCSKANPEGAEECEFCGARLTPLVVDPDEGGQPEPSGPTHAEGPGEAGDEGPPDWLARIRERAEEEAPEQLEPEEQETEGALGWLDRMRAAEGEEGGPPEGEVPEWMGETEGEPQAEAPEAEAEDDDWLGRLRDRAEQQADLSESEAAAAEDEPAAEPEEEISEGEPPFDVEPAEPAEPGELPGWLSDTSVDLEAEQEPQPELPEPELPPGPGEEPSDWFEETEAARGQPLEEETPLMEEPAPSGEEMDAVDTPAWLDDVESAEGESGPPSSPAFSDEEEWDPAAFELSEQPVAPEAEVEPEKDVEEPEPAMEEPQPAEPPAAEQAPSFEELPVEEDDLPHVPALVTDAGEGPRFEETDDFDLDAIELPDWLADARAGEGEAPETAKEGDLAPATIPTWLEAMRPVETFQPVVEGEPEEEEAVESVGPLAGLRGVLLAEPVVAKPRTATATGARLQVTERQYAQAELLQRIVDEEEHERTVGEAGRRRIPLARWLVSLALLLAVLLPPLTGVPAFATPERVSRDLGPLVETVNELPAERPVLVVFDYEPGYSAELDGVAGSLMEHLFARGLSVVTMSTRPTGPPLAMDMVGRIGAPHELDNGRNYLHLGYLSGGPIAVQLFSAAPRQALLHGFALPSDLAVESGWEAPVLRDVERLSDFGMIAVVASGTDSARQWAEQAHPFMGETPLVMVLSAGAEPLIRPYFESLDPQVDGILTGLPAAVAYEQINGRTGGARARWDGFGAGILAAEMVLAAGVAYGLVFWFLGRRRE